MTIKYAVCGCPIVSTRHGSHEANLMAPPGVVLPKGIEEITWDWPGWAKEPRMTFGYDPSLPHREEGEVLPYYGWRGYEWVELLTAEQHSAWVTFVSRHFRLGRGDEPPTREEWSELETTDA